MSRKLKEVIATYSDKEIGMHYITAMKRSMFVVSEDRKVIGAYSEASRGLYTLDATIDGSDMGSIVGITANTKGDILAVMYEGVSISGTKTGNAVYLYWRVGGIWRMKSTAVPKYVEPDCNYGSSMALSRDGTILYVGADTKENDQTTKSFGSKGAVYTFMYNFRKDTYIQGQLIRPPAVFTPDDTVNGFGHSIETDNDNNANYKTVIVGDQYGVKYKYLLEGDRDNYHWRHESEEVKSPPAVLRKIAQFFGGMLLM